MLTPSLTMMFRVLTSAFVFLMAAAAHAALPEADVALQGRVSSQAEGAMEGVVVNVQNSKTGAFTEYLLPRSTNIRRVFVDNATTPPTVWVGNNHGASILKLEPLE